MRPRAKTYTLAELRLSDVERAELAEVLPALEAERPRTRSQCVGGTRPCPWVGCRYHLALDLTPDGHVKLNFPHLSLDEMPDTCALDVAAVVAGTVADAEAEGRAAGPGTLEYAGARMNLTRERVRQLEERAIGRLRRSKHGLGLARERLAGLLDLVGIEGPEGYPDAWAPPARERNDWIDDYDAEPPPAHWASGQFGETNDMVRHAATSAALQDLDDGGTDAPGDALTEEPVATTRICLVCGKVWRQMVGFPAKVCPGKGSGTCQQELRNWRHRKRRARDAGLPEPPMPAEWHGEAVEPEPEAPAAVDVPEPLQVVTTTMDEVVRVLDRARTEDGWDVGRLPLWLLREIEAYRVQAA